MEKFLEFSQIIFKQQIPPVRIKRVIFVDGSLLLLLLLKGSECLLKGRRLITIRLLLLLGLWIGLIASLIAVLLLICGFRLLAFVTAAVWIDFIIRICVEILICERRLHIVPRAAACPHHSLIVVFAVVSLVRVEGRRILLRINWIDCEFNIFVPGVLLDLVRLA